MSASAAENPIVGKLGKGSTNDVLVGGEGDRDSKKMIGVVQLAFAYLFEQIKLRKNRSLFYIIHVSYLEVYNEQVLPALTALTYQLSYILFILNLITIILSNIIIY